MYTCILLVSLPPTHPTPILLGHHRAPSWAPQGSILRSYCVQAKVLVDELCPTLWDAVDDSHQVFRLAGICKNIAESHIPSCRGSSPPGTEPRSPWLQAYSYQLSHRTCYFTHRSVYMSVPLSRLALSYPLCLQVHSLCFILQYYFSFLWEIASSLTELDIESFSYAGWLCLYLRWESFKPRQGLLGRFWRGSVFYPLFFCLYGLFKLYHVFEILFNIFLWAVFFCLIFQNHESGPFDNTFSKIFFTSSLIGRPSLHRHKK